MSDKKPKKPDIIRQLYEQKRIEHIEKFKRIFNLKEGKNDNRNKGKNE